MLTQRCLWCDETVPLSQALVHLTITHGFDTRSIQVITEQLAKVAAQEHQGFWCSYCGALLPSNEVDYDIAPLPLDHLKHCPYITMVAVMLSYPVWYKRPYQPNVWPTTAEVERAYQSLHLKLMQFNVSHSDTVDTLGAAYEPLVECGLYMLSDPKFLEHARHTCLLCHRVYFTEWAFVQHVKTHDFRQMDTMLCLHRLQMRCSTHCQFCDSPAHNPQLEHRCPTLVNLATFLTHGSPESYGPGHRYLEVHTDTRPDEGTGNQGIRSSEKQKTQNGQVTGIDKILQTVTGRSPDDDRKIGASKRGQPECTSSRTPIPDPCESGTGQSLATDAGRDTKMARLQQGNSIASSAGSPHAGNLATTSVDLGQVITSGCSLERGRTDAADHQRWPDAISSMGRINKDIEADQRGEDEHSRGGEMCGDSMPVGPGPQHNVEVPCPDQEQGKSGQSGALVMAGLQSQSTGGLVRGASTLLSRHLAVGSLSGPATDLREISAGQTNPATPELRVVRILLNHKNLCYANSLIICLAWAAILMGGIDLGDWPLGGYELFRTLTAMSGMPINLATFQPFLWLFNTGPNYGWTIADLDIQNDVSEFAFWLLSRTQPRFVHCQWASQLLRQGHIEEQNGTERGSQHGPILIPIHDPSLRHCNLQTLINAWHDDSGLCRSAEKVGHVVVLSISRFLPETQTKNTQLIEITHTVRFPYFTQDGDAVNFQDMMVCGLIYHLGATPITGHYRAVLNCGHRWLDYEDGQLPDSMTQLSARIQTNVVMVWLKPLQTILDRTTIDHLRPAPHADEEDARIVD